MSRTAKLHSYDTTDHCDILRRCALLRHVIVGEGEGGGGEDKIIDN